MPDHYPQLQIGSRHQWRGWLTAHHDSRPGAWVVPVRSSVRSRVHYAEIVEETICFGWADTARSSTVPERSRFLLGPRHPGTPWSILTKHRFVRLIEQGLMQPNGLRVVAETRSDGSWTALDCVEDLIRAAR